MSAIDAIGQFDGNVDNGRRLKKWMGLGKVRFGAAHTRQSHAGFRTATIPEDFVAGAVGDRPSASKVKEQAATLAELTLLDAVFMVFVTNAALMHQKVVPFDWGIPFGQG